MNTNHYPSLELCNELTELWFPDTESHDVEYTWDFDEWLLVKPTITELLNELPGVIHVDSWSEISYTHIFSIQCAWEMTSPSWEIDTIFNVQYSWLFSQYWTLLDALAKVWIYCKKNNHLPKK